MKTASLRMPMFLLHASLLRTKKHVDTQQPCDRAPWLLLWASRSHLPSALSRKAGHNFSTLPSLHWSPQSSWGSSSLLLLPLPTSPTSSPEDEEPGDRARGGTDKLTGRGSLPRVQIRMAGTSYHLLVPHLQLQLWSNTLVLGPFSRD